MPSPTTATPTDGVILAIDQGTTGTTCLLIDAELGVVARASQELPQHFPEPGQVEHDLEEIWSTVLGCIAQIKAHQPAALAGVQAIGITNQRETCGIWRREDGRPLAKAIVWQDRRTTARCEALRSNGHEPVVKARTGLVLDPYFSATKLAYLCEHLPEVVQDPGKYAAGTIDTFLIHRLTGGASHATDVSNASRTSLYNLDGDLGRAWDPELCELFGVPEALLPEVRASNAEFGRTKAVPGLRDGIPIHGVAGDQQAATFGQACFQPGMVKCTYGTGAFLMLNTGDTIVRSNAGLLTTVGWQLDGQRSYCLEGSAYMAGAVIQWLRDGLGIIPDAPAVEALAASVADSGGVVVVPAHAGLGAPHWRPEARGLISGLTRGTGRAHIARAALEGIALEVADLLSAMQADLDTAQRSLQLRSVRVDGGAAANDLLMQMQSDVAHIGLERPEMLETTALGAALLAGIGCGLWPGLQTIESRWRCQQRFNSKADPTTIEALRKAWDSALAKA